MLTGSAGLEIRFVSLTLLFTSLKICCAIWLCSHSFSFSSLLPLPVLPLPLNGSVTPISLRGEKEGRQTLISAAEQFREVWPRSPWKPMHQYCSHAESPSLGYFSRHLQLAAGAAGSECKCGSTCARNFFGELGDVKFFRLSTGWSFAFATVAAVGSCLLGGRASCGSGAELPGPAGFAVWIMHGQGSA